MEGILIEMESLAPAGVYFAGLILLAWWRVRSCSLHGRGGEAGRAAVLGRVADPRTEGKTETSFTEREYLKAA